MSDSSSVSSSLLSSDDISLIKAQMAQILAQLKKKKKKGRRN